MGLFSEKLVSRELEPVLDETGTWIRTFSQVALTTRRGIRVAYRGPVLKPQVGTGSRLQFLCRTTAVRRARIRIPICVNAETVVKLFVDGDLVRRATLAPAAARTYTLRTLAQDITRWTEAREVSVLKLQFSSDNQSDSPIILFSDEQPQCRPLLLQRRGGTYIWKSAFYFLLAWANLLTLSIVALATLEIQQETLRIYAVLGTGLLWFAGLLGLPDLARIPIKAWIRRIFAATQPASSGRLGHRRRELAIVVLLVALAASGVACTEVIRCYWVRYQYTNLIRQARDQSDLTLAFEAFKLVPWRREAQILIEVYAFKRRDLTNPESFRTVGAALDKHPGVYAAIEQAARSNEQPSYLKKKPHISNPVAWYASIIIEGENEEKTELVDKAKSLLRLHPDPESELLLETLEAVAYFTSSDGELQERLVKNLEARLRDPRSSLEHTHSYVFASDSLFFYHLQGCEQDEASRWLEDELRIWDNAAEQTLWLRPPEKYFAYYVFGTYGSNPDATFDRESPGAIKAQEWVKTDTCDFIPSIRRIEDRTRSKFSTREAWAKKTIFVGNVDLKDVIDSLLKQGWRY